MQIVEILIGIFVLLVATVLVAWALATAANYRATNEEVRCIDGVLMIQDDQHDIWIATRPERKCSK